MKKKSSYFLRNFRNFNEVFRKDGAYDNIIIKKNQAFTFSLENTFWKNYIEGQSPAFFWVSGSPSLFRKLLVNTSK